jgi:Ca2+-binding RTX toxin-like protein
VENLTLTGTAALSGTGNVLNNVITGNMGDNLLRGEAGNDWLDGKAGADVMHGGAGNDSYTVDNVADQAVEESAPGMDAGGSDTVNAAVSYRLGGFVEHLTLVGTLNIEGTGNALANTITGNSAANALRGEGGNDRLIGGLGSDTMYGGEGNDSYAVDNAGDVASERLSTGGDAGGIDSVASSVSFTVDDFIENLTLTGTAAIDGTGNGLANQLTGNAAANTLRGGGGNDVLSGGSGDDWLYGDAGLDQLTGGLGADRFVLGGPSGASKDRVADFNAAQGDKLVFSGAEYGLPAGALDASRFSGTGVATSPAGTGQFVYSAATKSLLWDADGSGAGAAVGIATLNIAVAATDLLIL